MKKQIKVVAAARIENEKSEILCALRSPKMWDFPGGTVVKEEDIYTALKREIYRSYIVKLKQSNCFITLKNTINLS